MALRVDNKLYLSWDDIQDSIEVLAQKIQEKKLEIDSVTGLARGGLIPAVLLSHRLGLPYITYTNAKTLVVDDICDSGNTLVEVLAPFTAVLHYKTTAKFQPTFYAQVVGDEWIVYPWERKDSEAIPDYLKSSRNS